MTSPSSAPIFVVGVPRSGTTLLAAYLSSHSRLSCGTETDFFHFLTLVNEQELLSPSTWPNRAVEFLFRQVAGNGRHSVPEEYGLSQAEVYNYLNAQSPSVTALLSAITAPFTKKLGKHRWIEKTPNHLMHLAAIRRCFPQAAIIRIVRDPRDVALSIVKAPWDWAPRTFPGALSMWRYLDAHSSAFFTHDRNTHTVKYEDLVTNPREVLEMLCEFIGEEFEEAMLYKDKSYEQVNRLQEAWKSKVAEKPDQSRIGVWQRELDPHKQAISLSLIGDKLTKYGYVNDHASMPRTIIFPEHSYMRHPATVEWLTQQRLCMADPSESHDGYLFLGDPDRDNWLGQGRLGRLLNSFALPLKALGMRLRGKKVYWLAPTTGVSNGLLCRFTALMMGMVCSRHTVDLNQKQHDGGWRINMAKNPKLSPTMPPPALDIDTSDANIAP